MRLYNRLQIEKPHNYSPGQDDQICLVKKAKNVGGVGRIVDKYCPNISPENRLGICINPEKVRLIPNFNDPYTWDVSTPIQHMFTKQLSEHPISAVRLLSKEVGKSFQAIPSRNVYFCRSTCPSLPRLGMENDNLKEELTIQNIQMAAALEKETLEAEISALRLSKENLEARIEILEQDTCYWRILAGTYQENMTRYHQVLADALSKFPFWEPDAVKVNSVS
ncbi:hypothetical protein LOZ65_006849 [Ophidiomyces ophidiicola]|nr:hypothetical protein LOZ65_006849 [Ophidiomyces ophidiicola]